MENQDIAANYRDENSQLVMIPQCMFSFREQIPLFLCVCVWWSSLLEISG